MKNLYKKNDVFRCVHESHKGFKNSISVYHILEKKSCYPHGCLYFKWQCKQLSKKKKCSRGFNYVGRKCFGCKDFYEDKIHNYPELQIDPKDYDTFLKEYEDFKDWLGELRGKKIEISGKISGIKPHFQKRIYPKSSFLSFQGYILIFNEIFIERILFDDFVYALISQNTLYSLKLAPEDKIEASSYLQVDHGKLIFYRLKNIDVERNGNRTPWNNQSVLIAQQTATEFSSQPEECIHCSYGSIVDVKYFKDHHSVPRRSLLCLKGMSDYRDCYFKTEYCGFDQEANDSPKEKCTNTIKSTIINE
jgi:hypothetical protein